MPLPEIPFKKFELEVIKQNTPLEEKSVAILQQAKSVAVIDNATLRTANDIKLEINNQAKVVKELRLEFTRPIDDFKKTILDAEKGILLNLEEAKSIVAGEIVQYEEKLEQERQVELKRVQVICDSLAATTSSTNTVEAVDTTKSGLVKCFDQLAVIDRNNPTIKFAFTTSMNSLDARRDTIVADEKAEVERKRLAEQAKTQSAELAAIELEKARVAEERQKLEDERRQLAREQEARLLESAKFEAEKAAAKAEADKPKTNTVVLHDFEVVDAAMVPVEYLSIDEQKVRAAIKQGVREIPGIAITERKVVR